MESELAAFSERFTELFSAAEASFGNLILPSRIWQFAIIASNFALAWLLRAWLGARIHSWMRGLEGRPKWQLRTLLVLHRRLRLIFFVTLMWSATGLMRAYTVFPSRSYILALVATIATALLLVSLAARLVKNQTLRRIVTWGLWVYVTLYYLGLVEATSSFLDSLAIEFGEFRLTALAILKALVVTALLFTGARTISRTASGRIRDNTDISPSMRVLAVKLLQIILYGSAFFIGLKAVGFDLTGLAVLSGAVGLGLGFGLQKVVSNLVSGVIILLDKSIKPGDVISLGETFGWIESLGARYVSVVTRDGKEFLIPNEDLITSQVVNWSHSNEFVRLDIYFGTAYANDPHQVRRLAVEAAKSVNRVLTFRAPVCHIVSFGDSSVDYILRFWIKDPVEGLTNVRGAVFLALWDTFKANDVSIPFPQREVKVLPGSELATKAD
ncbi:MAG: mechanosensitive ion channel [Paracoccaceae bacterium]|nr:mechanosensitive ion channel [Paracoccaceae bacterium]